MIKQLLFATLAWLFFISCSKKNDDNNSQPPATIKEYFRGKLNGLVFNDTTLGKILSTPNNGLQITGFHPNGGIILWLNPYTGMTGENLVNHNNTVFIGNSGGQFHAGFINGKMQGSGKINILEITSSYLRGTFECIVPSDSSLAILPSQIVTEGEFKLKKP